MSGICHIRPVSVGLESQIWYLFIYIAGYLNVRKISETMGFRTFVVPLIVTILEQLYTSAFLMPCNHIRKNISVLRQIEHFCRMAFFL